MGRVRGAGGVYRRCGCEDPASGRAVGGRCPRLAMERSHGSWYLRLELGSGPGGIRRRVRRGGFPTRKAAEEELRRLRGPTGSPLTVAEWLGRWLANHPGAASTVAGYADHVERYLEPLLGDLLVAEVSVGQVERMLATIAPDYEQKGRPVTAATLHRIRATLRAALNAALRAGVIEENPGVAGGASIGAAAACGGVDCGSGRAVAAEGGAPERGGVDGRADRPVPQRHPKPSAVRRLPPHRAARAAARRGGRITLVRGRPRRRNRGDLPAGAAQKRPADRVRAQDAAQQPSDRAGPHHRDRLAGHRSRQRAQQEAFGEGYRDSGYVFTNLNGEPVPPGWLTHQFQRLIAEQGMPPIRLHDLRHGAAPLALAAGVELKVVQEMLGHSSIVPTADTCTSVLPQVAHTAAEKTAALLMHAAGIVVGTNRRRGKGPTRRKRYARATDRCGCPESASAGQAGLRVRAPGLDRPRSLPRCSGACTQLRASAPDLRSALRSATGKDNHIPISAPDDRTVRDPTCPNDGLGEKCPFVGLCAWIPVPRRASARPQARLSEGCQSRVRPGQGGESRGTRTHNLRIKSRLLSYQNSALSIRLYRFVRIQHHPRAATSRSVPVRFGTTEPTTSRHGLWDCCSSATSRDQPLDCSTDTAAHPP
ncbi:tyrosine-type recombinase/integrase [Spirillospora sp. CA-108201]